MQCQYYPAIAIGDKDLHESHSQLIKPYARFPLMPVATAEKDKECILTLFLFAMIATELVHHGLHMELHHHHTIFA